MNATQAEALKRVWRMAEGNHGGAGVCAKFLLGLYNGERFKFDLTELRRLDDDMWNACVEVLRLDAHPRYEVHDWLNQLYGVTDMGPRFELLAWNWRQKNAVKKPEAMAIQARLRAAS